MVGAGDCSELGVGCGAGVGSFLSSAPAERLSSNGLPLPVVEGLSGVGDGGGGGGAISVGDTK